MLNLALQFKEFVKNPVLAFTFLALVAVSYLYFDNKMVYESQITRQARRYQMGIDADLKMPTDDYAPMPRGIGKLAEMEKITRQSFTEDVKAHIRRAFPKK